MSKPSLVGEDGKLHQSDEDLLKGIESLGKFNVPYAKSRLDSYFFQREKLLPGIKSQLI
jgi:hypothetical protein